MQNQLSLFSEADRLGCCVTGTTSPNPPVGCVIYDATGERILGRGATQPAGGAHAEVMALRDADKRGEDVRGARAVVTLEPCNHSGRTGPCSHALLNAGIGRVDYLFADPNPLAVGGADFLRAQGVTVHGPYLDSPVASNSNKEWTPQWAVEPWLISTLRGRPHVTLKLASTIDGFVAATDKTSQWITGEQARQFVHEDRRTRDAIIVGTGTVLDDNPRLTARNSAGEPYDSQPLRVVMGCRDIPQNAAIYDSPGDVLHVKTRSATELLAALKQRGLVDVLVEGGPYIIGAFLREGAYDALQLYQAPALLLAGRRGVSIEEELSTTMSDIERLTPRSIRTYGSDVLWTLTR
ncbi:Riboflavin biosynthesis protein RibD [Corynebacterium urogenitale]|uniref:Riboflavin biosynthesis protein RibD n=1 Tax=Corynebacterium urogenitale TaxID=2487892 RepID=A0A5J6Z5Q1_9CORY|nr:bifunctional diaminohydroxyphosphoribosylaminopyrimidine deaminase/5-amino-6-(5-phosphoribosylamino)uracil reductase RibD [Corynebacterium urogenitale]QFQ02398.1 Riboflavin biosynthesis protein RibD [Corynebacterium urogenitale]